MAANKRTKAQHENDLQLIADLYLKQWTQADIVAHIATIRPYSISQMMVSIDLKTVQGRWRESSLIDMNEAKQRELARIDTLEREYWQAWSKSQQPRKSVSRSTASGKETVIQHSEERIGDSRYLEGVRWCIAQRCKILGIEAPVNVAGTLKVEDWRSQAIEDIKAGRVRYSDLAEVFDPDLATQLFQRAGVPVEVSE